MMRLLSILCLGAQISLAQLADPIVFTEKTHDFGSVKAEGGSVSTEFIFVNKSGRPVKVLTVQPSCGCTTPEWTREPVADGSTGVIKATFDPRGKIGFFNKAITVTTDFNTTPITLAIKGNVMGGGSNDEFEVVNGALLSKVSTFNIGKIYINKANDYKSFDIKNGGKTDLTFGAITAPPYIVVQVPPKLKPGEKGTVLISFDAQKKNTYGFVSENIEIQTNDATDPVKSFSVFATIEEYFPALTAKTLEVAPVMQLENADIKFGEMAQTATLNQTVIIKNTGKSTLNIRALQPNCTCITANAESKELKPGASSTIKIAFAPKGRPGIQNKSIAVYSNDPQNPVQRITLAGNVR